ncbi:hypothetical protein PybrP1_005249 [[Pythium] brassicae (nom. inval.)]|nr:hypothetical protein PybrP1_005249 [[Pythium] brassicae (nom. inval.)]
MVTTSEKVNAEADAGVKPIIYNGTNADDQLDPTRLGLVAAAEFDVFSPLSQLPKRQVREVAKYLGLPNWNAAASPCLRSRLAFGVEAVEDFVRRVLDLRPEHNMRVRFLAGNRAAVELEAGALETADAHVAAIASELQRLGFDAVELRAFRSGSLSGYTAPVEPTHHAALQ